MTSVMTVDEFGIKRWRNERGEHHREDGPAVEWTNGAKSWCINDKLHREGGPAIEYANGNKSWYLNGRFYSEEEYWEELDRRGWVKPFDDDWIWEL